MASFCVAAAILTSLLGPVVLAGRRSPLEGAPSGETDRRMPGPKKRLGRGARHWTEDPSRESGREQAKLFLRRSYANVSFKQGNLRLTALPT